MDASIVKSKLKEFLNKSFPHEGFNLEDNTNLLNEWFVDSLGIVQVVIFLEEEFDMEVQPGDVTDANFRDYLLSGVMGIIRSHDRQLLDKFVSEFPLDFNRRRWYDQDPYLWLIVNGLSYAGQDLLDAVADYLENEQQKKNGET